jgi:hypothetical protein
LKLISRRERIARPLAAGYTEDRALKMNAGCCERCSI